eukprot:TRINITY_DN7569_c0_g1_i1.p1 TRINITY_DN7569_c0_g1~~TRINITY_DN7569_c0_g1_i1.p1  ORF type:complete len:231 (-),score=28.33 TRINITY_DN7569_c0_g1_i1:470-1162(-)
MNLSHMSSPFMRKPAVSKTAAEASSQTLGSATVVNVKAAHIRPEYDNLECWLADSDANLYVGRAGRIFITDPQNGSSTGVSTNSEAKKDTDKTKSCSSALSKSKKSGRGSMSTTIDAVTSAKEKSKKTSRIFHYSGSKWRNPFPIDSENSRAAVLQKYEKYIRNKIREEPQKYDLRELQGKRLGCWCKPADCHADVLIRVLEETDRGSKRSTAPKGKEVETKKKRKAPVS